MLCSLRPLIPFLDPIMSTFRKWFSRDFRRQRLEGKTQTAGVQSSTSSEQLQMQQRETQLQHALDRLLELKADLRGESNTAFWWKFVQGVSILCHAQYGFIARSNLPEEWYGIKCKDGVMGVCYDNRPQMAKDTETELPPRIAYSVPTALPLSNASLLTTDLRSTIGDEGISSLPFPVYSYLCIPMPCPGDQNIHVGLLWTREGLAELPLSWTSVKLLLHAMEEMVLARAVEFEYQRHKMERRQRKATQTSEASVQRRTQGRQQNGFAGPSFKAFAPHLSHELRTPMQGVVGMLDVVYADVEDLSRDYGGAIAERLKGLSQLLEDAHDSAKRAVTASDNITFAYEFDMQVPDTPYLSDDDIEEEVQSQTSSGKLSTSDLLTGCKWKKLPISNPKRRELAKARLASRKGVQSVNSNAKNAVEMTRSFIHSPPHMQQALAEAMEYDGIGLEQPSLNSSSAASSMPSTRIRDLLRSVIAESLQVGGRPEEVSSEPTQFGEQVMVQKRSSNGQLTMQRIEWHIEPAVPEELHVREKDLGHLISCVFANSMKFTESGFISVRVTTNEKNPDFILISIKDSGKGIPEEFLPRLFKAFSRENESITRSWEGLGLGLLVARALSRRIGGDLRCVWSSTAPSNHGSLFEITVPIGKRPDDKASAGLGGNANQHVKVDAPSLSPALAAKARLSAPNLPNSQIGTTKALESAASLARKPPVSTEVASKDKLTTLDLTGVEVDRHLAAKYPFNCLVAEDNKIVREILVKLLRRLGYRNIYESYDGRDAVEKMVHSVSATTGTAPSYPSSLSSEDSSARAEPASPQIYPEVPIDMIFMDIWLPRMDGFTATKHIMELVEESRAAALARNPDATLPPRPTVLFTTADLSEELHKEVDNAGSKLLLKPHGLPALQKAIIEAMSDRASRDQENQ